MDREEKELLKKTVELEKENNDMLRSIKRSMRLSSIMSIVYWVFIIGSLVGAFYFIQPYWDKVIEIYNQTKGTLDSGASSFSNIMNGFKK